MFRKTVGASTACRITGVQMPNLRSWRLRYGLRVGTEEAHPQYSLRDVLAIAIYKNLVNANIPPTAAANFAIDTADNVVAREEKMFEEASSGYEVLDHPRYLKCFCDESGWNCCVETVPHMRSRIESFVVVVLSLVIRRIVNAWRDEFTAV